MSDVTVVENTEGSRYEAIIDGEVAGFADYRVEGNVVTFPHTVTDPAYGGQGVASAVARKALDDARERGQKVEPVCSFFAGYLDKHPEYADLRA